MQKNIFDVIIIGGSYAGLSAALTLARALRKVLVLDNGQSCNRMAPFSHNFLTHDGETPHAIIFKAREDVMKYPNIKVVNSLAKSAVKEKKDFRVTLEDGTTYSARKLVFATGITDVMPVNELQGFTECWGKSILHCPYCHGYEYRERPTLILAEGEAAFEYAKILSQWTDDLTILTNGGEQPEGKFAESLNRNGIKTDTRKINTIKHTDGEVSEILFEDGPASKCGVLYSSPEYRQSCPIPEELGCRISEKHHIETDESQRTSVPGVYAAGDCANMIRAISIACSSGTLAGFTVNKDLIEEDF
ncbi:MAG: NAD(P)/FAD-dependent oxidoreductase [Ignavibacteria bacterium]|nr:NAD(P)/FAD-dependent oxidoreductase [Ignavibacteria bacterium]